jgi:hypothetical protein
VEASALISKDRGYFVLANHGPSALRTHVDSTLAVRDVRQLTEGDAVAVSAERGGWTISLPGHSGAVLEWRSKQP